MGPKSRSLKKPQIVKITKKRVTDDDEYDPEFLHGDGLNDGLNGSDDGSDQDYDADDTGISSLTALKMITFSCTMQTVELLSNDWLALASQSSIQLLNIRTNVCQRLSFENDVTTLFSSGDFLIIGCQDGTVHVTCSQTRSFHDHTGSVCCLTTLADGHLVSGSCDDTIRIWNSQSRGYPNRY